MQMTQSLTILAVVLSPKLVILSLYSYRLRSANGIKRVKTRNDTLVDILHEHHLNRRDVCRNLSVPYQIISLVFMDENTGLLEFFSISCNLL